MKKENIKEILKDYNFKEVIRIQGVNLKDDAAFADRKKIGHVRGCTLAHLRGLSYGNPPFIILEDDCNINVFKDAIEFPDNADAVYLGSMSWGMKDGKSTQELQYKKVENYEDIYKSYNLLGAHSILYLSNRYVDNCIKVCYASKDTPQDVGFANSHKNYNIYVIGTPIFYQEGYYAEETKKHLTEHKVDESFINNH